MPSFSFYNEKKHLKLREIKLLAKPYSWKDVKQNRSSRLHLFIHLILKYLLREYHVPYTVADTMFQSRFFKMDMTCNPKSLTPHMSYNMLGYHGLLGKMEGALL